MQHSKMVGPHNRFLSRIFLAFLLLGPLHACTSSSGGVDSDPTEPGETSETEGGSTVELDADSTLLDSNLIAVPASLNEASSAVLIDFNMTAVGGGLTTARAQLFTPSSPTPAGGYPLVVWAHGTTGIANPCTPSLSFANFGNGVVIDSLLAEGYAVLAPDYEGFGTPTIQPYYVRESHANSILDAIPAAHEVDGIELSTEWALVGHSLGGHVALSTARAEQDPAFALQAVVALAPGTDLVPLSMRAFEAVDLELAQGQLQTAAERVFFLNVNGGFVANALPFLDQTVDPAIIFGDDVGNLLNIAVDEVVCGEFFDAVNDALTVHVTTGGTLSEFGGLRRDWFTEPSLVSLLEEQSLNDESQSAPLLVVQGDSDTQIPAAATTDFVNLQRSLGTEVTYELIPGATHADVARSEFDIAIEWLVEQFPPQ